MANRFNVADLGAIETRVSAWVAGCEPLLNGFRNIKDFDPYMYFAMNLTQIPYEILIRDKNSKDPELKAAAKRHRQIAKPGVLGCCYRLSGGQMGIDKNGDPIKQGLWGYAEAMGVEMSQEQAHEIVRVFRESYKEIVEFWYLLEGAVADVLREGTIRVKRELGPRGCIKISKFAFNCQGNARILLRIQLPSGRFLHYFDAFIADTKMPWQKDGEDVFKPTFCYAGQNQTTKKWTSVTSHGGKIFENIVQGIARDVLAEKLLDFESSELPVVAHVHDEGICQTEDSDLVPGAFDMEYIMSQPVSWAPDLPLAAVAFESAYYHK
jgi:DNA polymerase